MMTSGKCPHHRRRDDTCHLEFEVDARDRLKSFRFSKVSCGHIPAQTGYSSYCAGRDLAEILKIPFLKAAEDLRLSGDEERFFLYLEWDALRSALAAYLGIKDEDLDTDRCQIASVEQFPEGTRVSQLILPPQDFPDITIHPQ